VPLAVYRPAADFPTTYSRKINAGVQRSLGKDTTFTAEYASVRASPARAHGASRGGSTSWSRTRSLPTKGFSLSVNRRMSKELTFLVAYGA